MVPYWAVTKLCKNSLQIPALVDVGEPRWSGPAPRTSSTCTSGPRRTPRGAACRETAPRSPRQCRGAGEEQPPGLTTPSASLFMSEIFLQRVDHFIA